MRKRKGIGKFKWKKKRKKWYWKSGGNEKKN